MKAGYKIIISGLSILLFVFASALAVYADSLDKIQIIKISARDKQAIIKMDDGKIRIVKVGEEIIIKDDDVQSQSQEEPATAKAEVRRMPDQSVNNEVQPSGPAGQQVRKGKIPGRKAKVVDIANGKIVLEEATKEGTETIIMSLKVPGPAPKAQPSESKAQVGKKEAQAAKPQMQAQQAITEIYRIKKYPQSQNQPLRQVQSIQQGQQPKAAEAASGMKEEENTKKQDSKK